jgi:MFS family permease
VSITPTQLQHPVDSQTVNSQRWDTKYEWKAVTLLGLGFGLVGLDRWIISPLFPFMMKDLHLSYQDLGNIVGVMGITWGVFAAIMGGLSDRIGRRKILLPSIFLFSILSGFSGIVTGLMSLILIRAMMGVGEGSFCPVSFAATSEVSEPKRRGFNQGIQQCTFAFFGLGLGPIIATQLLAIVPSWRWVFLIVAIPGLIVGGLMYFVIRDTSATRGSTNAPATYAWRTIFHRRNIILAMIALLCAMSGVFVLCAMIPNYLIDYLHLPAAQMGYVTAAIGFGGGVGQLVIPGLSDIYGRKVMAVLSFLGAAVFLLFFSRTSAHPAMLFGLLFIISFFCLGLISLLSGPIATESAPAGLTSTTIGIVVGAGEIFGGGIAPAIAGYFAQHYGIKVILYLALAGVVFGVIICSFLKETAPRKGARLQKESQLSLAAK